MGVSPAWLLPTMQGYQPSWWRLDVLAGLAAGTVVIPQAMAYATIAGLPVEIGLYTCMAPMVVYALLGGARALSVSTTSTIAVLVATTLADLSPRSSDDLLRDAFTLTALVGVCLLGMRAFRLGSLVENISPATLTGVRIGVGLTVAVGQLPNLLGVTADPDADGFFAKLADMLGKLPDAEAVTVAVSASAVAALLVLRKFVPRVPGPLVAVAGGIILVATTNVEARGLDLIAPVPTGLPGLSLPVWGDVFALLPGALAIAVMAFLETVLVARTNRQRAEPQISTDQELLAVGVASLAGGLTQSLPPAGGFSQSAVNLRSGARSQLSGLVTALLAVAVAMFLAPLLDDLPQAVLAAMVMVAILGPAGPARLRPLRAHRPRRAVGRRRGHRSVPDRGHVAGRRRGGRPDPGARAAPGQPATDPASLPAPGWRVDDDSTGGRGGWRRGHAAAASRRLVVHGQRPGDRGRRGGSGT